MHHKHSPIILLIAGAIMTVMQIVPAWSADDDQSGHNVVQYFDLVYSQQQCAGTTAYKIQYASMRWWRANNNRRISSAPFNMGMTAPHNCSGDLVESRHINTNINPRFDGPGDNWTQQYSRSVSWPYVRGATNMGANLKGVIRNDNGDFVGSLCSKVYLFGNGDCS